MSDRDEAERASIRSSLEAQTASSRQTGAFVWRLPKVGIRQNLPFGAKVTVLRSMTGAATCKFVGGEACLSNPQR